MREEDREKDELGSNCCFTGLWKVEPLSGNKERRLVGGLSGAEPSSWWWISQAGLRREAGLWPFVFGIRHSL